MKKWTNTASAKPADRVSSVCPGPGIRGQRGTGEPFSQARHSQITAGAGQPLWCPAAAAMFLQRQ